MVNTLYDIIGKEYDGTRTADPRITRRLYSLLNPTTAGKYLDVACGTGNYTIGLSDLGVLISGIDQSELMISRANKKAPAIGWKVGDAENLPFPGRSFQRAICTLATHHFRSVQKAFNEVFRLMSGGRFVIFTAYPEQMMGYWLNEYFPRAMKEAMKKMLSRDAVFQNLTTAGFQHIREEIFEIPRDLQDLFLHCGKYRPELYLLPQVRAGISTFAKVASEEEVLTGCRRLEQDIESGRIDQVMSSYANSAGDYVFVAAEKE